LQFFLKNNVATYTGTNQGTLAPDTTKTKVPFSRKSSYYITYFRPAAG